MRVVIITQTEPSDLLYNYYRADKTCTDWRVSAAATVHRWLLFKLSSSLVVRVIILRTFRDIYRIIISLFVQHTTVAAVSRNYKNTAFGIRTFFANLRTFSRTKTQCVKTRNGTSVSDVPPVRATYTMPIFFRALLAVPFRRVRENPKSSCEVRRYCLARLRVSARRFEYIYGKIGRLRANKEVQ